MGLNYKKAVSITGESVIDGVVVVYMSATVSKDSPTSYTQYIQDETQYNIRENRKTVRADIEEFSEKMYELEDSFIDSPETKTGK